MKIPLSWLAEYVPLRLAPEEMAHRLTMAGIETAYAPGPGAGWGDSVVVGQVVELKPHPNADRLRLATVDLGADRPTVVCGAPNIEQGQRIAFALLGARLRDGHDGEPMELTAATIRGVVSEGMVCSERELGLSDAHEGILVLAPDAPIGMRLADYMGGDAIEVEVTTNRGDCLSVLGVAREIAAFSGERVTDPPADYEEGARDIDLQVRITDSALCARYTATVVRGVTVGPSPEWLRRRLIEAGQRPINTVVDATNYVMLELGQPLHAFDLREVRQGTIVVRPAHAGESFTALDGTAHELAPPMLLIADPERAIALAGVMGGENSEVTETTTDVLLESATFNGINTRRTAAALRSRTEASSRFEKGLHPTLAERALKRVTRLLLEIAGGTADRGFADAYPAPTALPSITLTHEHIKRLLGTDFSDEQITGVLSSLGFETAPATDGALTVTPPYWRTDVTIEEDLIEEVTRVTGYDSMPATPLAGAMAKHIPQPARDLRERVRDLLVEAGLQETISPTLVSEWALSSEGTPLPDGVLPLAVANPLSLDHRFLRTGLRASLLTLLAKAVRQQRDGATLFEVGRTFLPREGDLPQEREMAVMAMAGPRGEGLWAQGEDDLYGFFDAKGTVEAVLAGLGLQASFEPTEDALLHPGRAAKVIVGGTAVGVVGELHPRTLGAFDIAAPAAALAELDIDALGALGTLASGAGRSFQSFTRFPTADRDLAFLVDQDVPAGRLQSILEAEPLVTRVMLFDRFEGEGLPAGKKSLAFRLELQSDRETLAAEQINRVVEKLTRRIAHDTGAELRG